MNEGDLLFYIDVGCQINYENGTERFRQYIQILDDSKYGMTGFELGKESQWTKKDLKIFFNVSDEIWESPQLHGTTQFLRKCDHVLKFVDAWLKGCLAMNGTLIDDSSSDIPNDIGFREHRHDQSDTRNLLKIIFF